MSVFGSKDTGRGGRDPLSRGKHGGRGSSRVSNTSWKGKHAKDTGKGKGGKGGKGGAAGGLDRWG